MADRDADESREATEWGKRNMRRNELFQSIQYDIRETSKFGGSSTRYRLNDDDIKEFLDEILEWLSELGYSVTFNHPYLDISWQLEQEE